MLSFITIASTLLAGSAVGESLQEAAAPVNQPQLLTRQNDFPYNESSICYSYGIDFQTGGSYFIDSRSTESFTIVSQFEQCEPNAASYVLLINDDTGDQWECTGVPTTPDLTDQMSTCPITKSQMVSGNWAILIIGNNGDGSPFAWQRTFVLTVGVPTTTTTTSTITYTEISTPIATVTSTSTITDKTTVPNTSTVTIPAKTRTITVTPKPSTITTSKMITRTFNRWTKTLIRSTATVTPKCTIPPRPRNPDPRARILPTIIPLPKGLTIDVAKPKERRMDDAASPDSIRKRFEHLEAFKDRLERDLALQRRAPDAPTITVVAPEVFNTTTTSIAPTSTLSDVVLTTSFSTLTAPPSTVRTGTTKVTTTLPAKTRTITKIGYTTTWATKTQTKTWVTTKTTTNHAAATSCYKRGGHYGKVEL